MVNSTINNLTISKDGIELTFDKDNFSSIKVDGVPFCQKSELYVMKPEWAGAYYSFDLDQKLFDHLTTETKDNGDQVVIVDYLDMTNTVLKAKEQFVLSPGRELSISGEYTNTSTCLALLEHCILDICPAAFSGQSVTITDNNGHKTVRRFPLSNDFINTKFCKFAEAFSHISLQTNSGVIDIAIESTNIDFSFFDYRRPRYLGENPQIWFGILEHDFAPKDRFTWEIRIKFPPKAPKYHSEKAMNLDATGGKPEKVLRPEIIEDVVIPTPKSIKWEKGSIPLTTNSIIVCSKDIPLSTALYLQDIIDEKTNIRPPIIKGISSAPLFSLGIDLKEDKPEAYRIKSDDKTFHIDAQTTIGLYHAARTIAQLLRLDDDGVSWKIRRADIHDWPSFPVRGVSMYSGKNAGTEQQELIRKLIGEFKLNTLIHHIVYGEWKSHPELACEELLMPKADMDAVYKECQYQGIEYVPFFPAFGLTEWLRFKSNHPKSLNPASSVWNDPDEIKIIQDIFEECIAEFSPKYIHIAHDELFTATSEQIINSINMWYKWLKDRNVKTMIWSDLLLARGDSPDACNAPNPEVAKERRDGIPKDIIITDWHYEPANADKYKSLGIFAREGFDVIGATWFHPQNIFSYGKAFADLYKQELTGRPLGQIATTWAGWNFHRESMDNNLRQIADYILTAESAWNGGLDYKNEMDIPFDLDKVFYRIWGKPIIPSGVSSGKTLDLSKAVNFDLVAHDSMWLSYLANEDLRTFPTGTQWLDRFKFRLSDNRQGILFSNELLSTETKAIAKLGIDLNTSASTIVFCCFATQPINVNAPIGSTEFTYEDNTKEVFEWSVGKNVFCLGDHRSAKDAPIVWTGKSTNNERQFVHAYLWQNPKNDKNIKSVNVISYNKTSSIVLLGITLINDK